MPGFSFKLTFRVLLVLLLAVLGGTAAAQDTLPERLAALDPARPGEYKRLAEEVAARSTDPETRATALRLFHIAAWLQPETLAAGSLRSMIALARSPEEEKRFRAAAYLLDPAAEPTSLRSVATSTTGGARSGPPPAELLQAVRQLRRGEREAARQSLSSPSVRDYLAVEDQQALRDELQALLAANALNQGQLRRVLELELAWSRETAATAGTAPHAPSAQPWNELGRPALATKATGVTLLDLTEFDPRECVYRSGKWSRE